MLVSLTGFSLGKRKPTREKVDVENSVKTNKGPDKIAECGSVT